MRTVHQPGEISGHSFGTGQGFRSVGQQFFAIDTGSDEVSGIGFEQRLSGEQRVEVMIEGALGGFVEFLGVESFVRRGCIGFRWVWRWFDHGCISRVIELPRFAAIRRGGSHTQVADRDSRTGRPEGLPRTAAIKPEDVVRPEIAGCETRSLIRQRPGNDKTQPQGAQAGGFWLMRRQRRKAL